jgi:hypothetical protein
VGGIFFLPKKRDKKCFDDWKQVLICIMSSLPESTRRCARHNLIRVVNSKTQSGLHPKKRSLPRERILSAFWARAVLFRAVVSSERGQRFNYQWTDVGQSGILRRESCACARLIIETFIFISALWPGRGALQETDRMQRKQQHQT